MIYPHLDLRLVSLIAGIWLVLSHGFALVRPAPVQQWMRKFPRSKVFGTFLLVVDAVWAFAIVAAMDMGEFTYMRNTLLVVIVVASFLTFKFVDEFLAVRALGIFVLLLAEPLIEAAFLQPEKWRLLVVLLAYVLAVLGMVWVGIPYVLRDQIDWMRRSKAAWSAATIAGMLYGGLMAGFALIH
jgi:hypothetical protein